MGTKVKEIKVNVCDLCHEEHEYVFTCSFCGKEACARCSRKVEFYSRMPDLPLDPNGIISVNMSIPQPELVSIFCQEHAEWLRSKLEELGLDNYDPKARYENHNPYK